MYTRARLLLHRMALDLFDFSRDSVGYPSSNNIVSYALFAFLVSEVSFPNGWSYFVLIRIG